jgi:hypothetical protein
VQVFAEHHGMQAVVFSSGDYLGKQKKFPIACQTMAVIHQMLFLFCKTE